jgi:hypothetical protein
LQKGAGHETSIKNWIFPEPAKLTIEKEIQRNGEVWKADRRASKWHDNSSTEDVMA